MRHISKSLTAIAIIAVCAVLLYFGYIFFNKKQAQTQIDFTKSTIVTQLMAVGNLETARMSMQKTVEGKNGLEDLLPGRNWDNTIQNFLFGDKIQLIAYAEVVAGFDITQVTTGSITVESGNIISIQLPAAKILSSYLTKETQPFTRETGVFATNNAQLETEIRNKTLELMTQEAIDNGILQAAEKNAKTALTPLMQSIGFTLDNVTIQTQQ